MEKLSTKGAVSRPVSGLMMTGLAAIVAVSLCSTGCGKSKPPVVQVVEQNTNQTAEIAAVQPPTPGAPAVEAVQPPAEPDLKELNRSLLRWVIGNRRRPQNFEEFAATAGVTIPPPPAGKKYILGKDMHIVLVDR